MDAEITSSGDVMVEGQHVGQLNGFRFTPDPQAAGEEARTLNAAAQKALASEIEGRATRVSEAVDEAFVLANDGLIRWLGEPVGRIAEGAHILEPHVRVIADEHLTGPSLELVQRRVDLWIQQHVKKLLGPLAEIEKGEGLDGMARGIAFQIAEALGVLERVKVADEVKALPQDARGALRKLGVRFGAYHLYLPALLKPAPRALAAQLWALKNGGVEGVQGLEDVPHLASSGRTSFVADQNIAKGFYRAAGFRVCGERAVRVDILERLADLIRPAIAYRPGVTPGDPPAGSADGDGFVVTMGMTSLAGCSGEAFGSILKSLGYVMDRRAGPPITVALLPKAATEPLQPAITASDDTPAEAGEASAPPESAASAPETPGDADLESRLSLARQSELIAAALEGGALEAIEPLPAETAPSTPAEPTATPEPATEVPAEAPAEVLAETSAVAQEASEPHSAEPSMDATVVAPEPADSETAAADTPEGELPTSVQSEPPVDAAPAEPVEIPLIEVWRPHRHNVHNRRPADQRGNRRGTRAAQGGGQAASAQANVSGENATPGGEAGARPPRHEGPRQEGARADGARNEGARNDGARNGNQRNRFRDARKRGPEDQGQRDENRSSEGRGRGDNAPRRDDRSHAAPQGNERPKPRDKQPDPNSPFAKLAALKAQLENDRK